LHEVFLKLKKFHEESNRVSDDFALINTRRLYYASILAILLHIFTILLYWFNTQADIDWKSFILYANGAMLCIWIASFFITGPLRRHNKPGSMDYFVQYFIACALILFSISITVADQLVSNTITPYTIICVIIGVALLFRPLFMSLIYISSYIIFFFALEITNHNPSSLLTSRMDGLTCIGIALFISVIMWRYNMTSSLQKERIESQQLQLEEANKELEKIAYNDPLTGLPNRRYFDDVVNREVALIDRKGYESCLVMLDIDFFKNINDVYGHPVGDNILIQISKVLSENMRKSDSLCRLGGEEFIILLPHTHLKNAIIVAEKLRGAIESSIFIADNNSVRITASFGVSSLSYSRETSFIHNYTKADNALYLAKQSGRNCVKTG
jgi:diguanylate cyclase